MVYRQLCICDIEQVYLKKLSAYLNRKPGFMWRIKTYTNLEACLKERPEVLLVSGNALFQWSKSENKMIFPEVKGSQIILLEDELGNPEQCTSVKKYQDAGSLYEDLLEILAEEIWMNTEVIGVYGPANGQNAEILARELGKELLKTGDVLIVSLVEFPVYSLTQSDTNGMGEWFYYYSQKMTSKLRLSEWVVTEEGLDFLQGFRTIYDERQIQLDEWHSFFKEGLRKSRYRTAILIFDRMPEYIELFMWCDTIYVQWGEDGYGALRKQKFEKMTAYMEIQELMEKFKEK